MSQENENIEVESEEVEELTETIEETTEDQIDWEARALKAEAAIIKNKTKAKKTQKTETKLTIDDSLKDELQIVRLEARGVTDADEIKLIIEKSKLLGVTPVEAMNDELVIGLLERNRKLKQDDLATPGTSSRSKTIERTPEVIKKDFFKGNLSKENIKSMIKDYHKN